MARAVLEPDLTLATIARALGHESEAAMRAVMPLYIKRGFPEPDPVTGRIDPVAFERWRRLRTPHLFPELTSTAGPRDPRLAAIERKGGRCGAKVA